MDDCIGYWNRSGVELWDNWKLSVSNNSWDKNWTSYSNYYVFSLFYFDLRVKKYK